MFSLAALLALSAALRGSEATEVALSRPLILRWVLEDDDLVSASAGFQGEALYVQTSDGIIASVSAPDGRLLWKGDVGGDLSSSPPVDQRAVYIASEPGTGTPDKSRGMITALSRASGITIWSRALSSPVNSNLQLADRALFGSTKDGRLFSLSTETGEILWSVKYPHAFSATLLVSGRKLFLQAADGTVLSFDTRTGKPLWRYRTLGPVRGVIAAAGARVYVGSADGYVTALEESAGGGVVLRWRRRVGTSVIGVAHTARGVVAVTADNFVQLLSPKRGSRLWKQRMPGRVFAQPLTDSESALFATPGGEACIVLSLESGRQVNYLSVGEGNGVVAMPVLTPSALVVPTREGLMAFSQPETE